MKLPIIVVLTTISCLTDCKLSYSDEKNLKLLLKTLKAIDGLSKCHVLVEGKINDKKIVSTLLKQLAKSLPLMSIVNGSPKWPNAYKSTDFTLESKSYEKSREQPGTLNKASASALVIYIFSLDSVNNYRYTLNTVIRLRDTLSIRTSLPKFLLINIVNRKLHSYKFLLCNLQRTFDIEVLEVTRGNKKRGIKKIPTRNFNVHTCNAFKGSCRVQKLSQKVHWFRDKLKDLRGSRVRVNWANRPSSKSVEKAIGWSSNFANYLKATLNFTYSVSRSVDMAFPQVLLSWGQRNLNYLKVCEFYTLQLYTPLILDVQIKNNYSDFFMCLVALPMILLLLRWCSLVGGFDPRTWSNLSIVKMLLGLDNPRDPKLTLESILFVVVSVCGIFSANEFYESVTSIIVPVQLERKFNTLDNLIDSNLTLYLEGERAAMKHPIMNFAQFNETPGIRYVLMSDKYEREIAMMWRMTLPVKSVALSVVKSSAVSQYYGANVKIGDRVIARQSDVTEEQQAMSQFLPPHSPFVEKFSDAYWRFREMGFTNFDGLECRTTIRRAFKFLDRRVQVVVEEQDETFEGMDQFTRTIALAVLIGGATVPLMLLILEITIIYTFAGGNR